MLNLYLSFVNYCLTTPVSSGELSASAFLSYTLCTICFFIFSTLALTSTRHGRVNDALLHGRASLSIENAALCAMRIMMPLAVP